MSDHWRDDIRSKQAARIIRALMYGHTQEARDEAFAWLKENAPPPPLPTFEPAAAEGIADVIRASGTQQGEVK